MKTWYLLLWITVHAVLVDAQIPAVESITIASDVSTARQCVYNCIAENNVQCSVNSCYCAPYIRSSLNSQVSACVTGQECPDSSDVGAATSAISSYCDKYYAAVGATPSAVPTSAIQDTSINVLPGATPTSTPSATAAAPSATAAAPSATAAAPSATATATSSPGNGQDSPISNTAKIVGIVIGGAVTLFASLLFLWARYKSHRENQRLKQWQHGYSGQTGAPKRTSVRKQVLLGAQIASAALAFGSLIVAIYFGIKQRPQS